ncbi:MAG: sterol desaturase family protein [Bacteriovoracia bacterium]
MRTLSPGKNIRLFENSLLEKLTYVHPIFPISLWGPVSLFLFVVSPWNQEMSWLLAAGLFLLGLFVWTFTEYVLHRFVFHFKPKGILLAFQERIVYLFHGIHHDDPGDERRLLMPPVAAILLASGFYFLFWLVLGSINVNAFYSGFLVGYLVYDYIHFATHFVAPKSAWFKELKRYHMLHHFQTPNARYGVSSKFWDRIFGT